MKKKEIILKLTELGIEHDPLRKKDELYALLPEEVRAELEKKDDNPEETALEKSQRHFNEVIGMEDLSGYRNEIESAVEVLVQEQKNAWHQELADKEKEPKKTIAKCATCQFEVEVDNLEGNSCPNCGHGGHAGLKKKKDCDCDC